MKLRALRFCLLLVTLVLVGCDHASKIGAKASLAGKSPLAVVSGILDLRYTENHDTAFSVFESVHFPGKSAILMGLSLLMIVAIFSRWWARRSAGALEQTGYAFVVAGAIGNLTDRVARGYVVDFIHLTHWPVFNLADMAIIVGVGLLLLARRDPKLPRLPPQANAG